jgi:3-hydroxyisobutyrate dehydrogenase-like beta-hydroxyacid dehydrogenase
MGRLSKVGFIGLGNMGRPMAVCLLKAGFTLTVLDVTRVVQQAFVDFHGAHSASSLSELGSSSDAVITMLPNGHKVSRVVLSDEGDDRKDYRPKRYVSFHWYPPSSLKRSQ